MANDERYIQFPLFLLREFFLDKNKCINDIITFGVYYFARRSKYEIGDVINTLIYDFYHNRLTPNIQILIDEYIKKNMFDRDDDYKGFNTKGKFEPSEESIDQLIRIFEIDVNFKNKSIIYYQMSCAYDFFNLQRNIISCVDNGNRISAKIPLNEPFPMANLKHLFNFRGKNKTEFENAQFCAFIALRSIMGIKKYVKANKKLIISRMFGFSSSNHFVPETDLCEDNKKFYYHYSKRYQIDKIIRALEEYWGVITYSSNMRGMYISINGCMSLDELALIAEGNKKKTKDKISQNRKQKAKQKALETLGLNR